MCGIFSILNVIKEEEIIIKNFMNGRSRGPENSNICFFKEHNLSMGFHRLAINGLNNIANQPMFLNDYTLVCNGEIYNFKYLHTLLQIENKTTSDCEIIIHLYEKYGIEETLHILDGVYAFILFDIKKKEIIIARDQFGVRPLFQISGSFTDNNNIFGFASEIKMLTPFENRCLKPYPPGTYSIMSLQNIIYGIFKIHEKSFVSLNVPISHYLTET